ncbi:MAG: hypothetical protein ACLFRN_07240 [Halothece sp.]
MGVWDDLNKASNLTQISELLGDVVDQFKDRGENFRNAWEECARDKAIPEVPIVNPITGEQIGCIPNPFNGGELEDGNKNPPDGDLDDDAEDEPPTDLPRPPIDDPIYIPPTRNPDPTDNPDFKPNPIPIPPSPPLNLPSIPRRRLPSLERPTDEDALLIFQDPIIGVERSAFSRVYGCMLSNSISLAPAVFLKCRFPKRNQRDRDQEKLDFILYQLEKLSGRIIRDNHRTLSTNVVQLPNTGLSISPETRYSPVFGSSFLHELAESYRISSRNAFQSADANVNIYVKFINCGEQEENDFGDIGDYDYRPFPLNSDSGGDECFVPIRNFRENEPEQQGMKRQLQIIFEGEPDDKGRPRQKQISLPSPLPVEELTEDLLKGNIPETWDFGTMKVETDIIPYGHIRFYAREDTNDADDLLDDLIELIDGSEKMKTDTEGNEITTRRYSRRSRNIITGEFTRKKAFLFEWRDGDGQPPLCQTFTF